MTEPAKNYGVTSRSERRGRRSLQSTSAKFLARRAMGSLHLDPGPAVHLHGCYWSCGLSAAHCWVLYTRLRLREETGACQASVNDTTWRSDDNDPSSAAPVRPPHRRRVLVFPASLPAHDLDCRAVSLTTFRAPSYGALPWRPRGTPRGIIGGPKRSRHARRPIRPSRRSRASDTRGCEHLDGLVSRDYP